MKSATAVTYEMEEMDYAAEELVSGINRKLSFCKNTCAILLCDAGMDFATLSDELHKRLNCDIIGATAFASCDNKTGYNDMAAMLTVMSADDVFFSIELSEPVTPLNIKETVGEVYTRACRRLEGEPRLILAIPPFNFYEEISQADYVRLLDSFSGGVPVFGGFPSAAYGGCASVFADGISYTDRLGIVVFSGNIRPVFSLGRISDNYDEREYHVTHSEGNIMYNVGDKRFIDFLHNCGYHTTDVAEMDTLYQSEKFLLMRVVMPGYGKDSFLTRVLVGLNKEDGSAVSTIDVPEGSLISLGLIRMRDIERSCLESVKNIIDRMEEASKDGYQFSSVFCVSCTMRNSAMGHRYKFEADTALAAFPKELAFSGFYANGELAPIYVDGKLKNEAHHVTIAFCAI